MPGPGNPHFSPGGERVPTILASMGPLVPKGMGTWVVAGDRQALHPSQSTRPTWHPLHGRIRVLVSAMSPACYGDPPCVP